MPRGDAPMTDPSEAAEPIRGGLTSEEAHEVTEDVVRDEQPPCKQVRGSF